MGSLTGRGVRALRIPPIPDRLRILHILRKLVVTIHKHLWKYFYEFMEIQSGDSEKLQKDMKRHLFYKAWRMRAAPDQKIIILKKIRKFSVLPMNSLDLQ